MGGFGRGVAVRSGLVAAVIAGGGLAATASALPPNMDQLRSSAEIEATPPTSLQSRHASRAATPVAILPDLPYFDSRPDPGSGYESTAGSPRVEAARAAMLQRLGPDGVVAIDRVTGTPRLVARLGSTLTAPSAADPAKVALGFVARNQALFRLDQQDLGTLELTDRYTAPGGLTTMHWHQSVNGIELTNEELAANVDSDGRLLNMIGPARSGIEGTDTDPAIGAPAALSIAADDAGASKSTEITSGPEGSDRQTDFAGGDRAHLVLYGDSGGPRLAWQVELDADSQHYYQYDIDASDGKLLSRQNLVDSENASTFDLWPEAQTFGPFNGGQAQTRPLLRLGNGQNDPWRYNTQAPPYGLPFQTLGGNQAFLLLDYNDNDGVGGDASNFVQPSDGSNNWVFAPSYQNLPAPYRCPPGGRCTWSPTGLFANWYENADQDGTQAYWFVNQFHDHLMSPSIGFTEASGNFELVNQDGQGGVGNDDLFLQTVDGANTAVGYPDSSHVDNANMLTLADGQSPRMQMYLFTQFPAGKPPIPGVFETNGGDDASIVYHEYTHGLSNRLVGGPSSQGNLNAEQSAAMGEGWSDWYAFDYLVAQGLIPDNAKRSGELIQGRYTNFTIVRTQALDCAVGASKTLCPAKQGGKAGSGGYTFGDYGKVLGKPEFHADGEIWVQTLWDLRQAMINKYGNANGVARTEQLVTNGLRLTPIKPSYLDARNGILQANAAAQGFNAEKIIWKVFANRGMGSNARTSGPDDEHPRQGFKNPTKKKHHH